MNDVVLLVYEHCACALKEKVAVVNYRSDGVGREEMRYSPVALKFVYCGLKT